MYTMLNIPWLTAKRLTAKRFCIVHKPKEDFRLDKVLLLAIH